MLVDIDVTNADLALLELPRARTAMLAKSLLIVRHIHQTIGNKGIWPNSIEHAQSEAWFAVGAVRHILESQNPCLDALWNKAIELTKRWRALLTGPEGGW
jgi:hypothetical protein